MVVTSRSPSGWKSERLGDLGKWLSGGTPSIIAQDYWDGQIPWVSPKDMKHSRLWDSIDHVTPKALGNGTRLAPAHALLLVVRGMILAHSFPVARAEVSLAFNQDIKALVTREDVDSDFLLWWLAAHESVLLGVTTESTHGTKRMPTDALWAIELHLPPLPEQRAIASALSDVDALLSGLDRLINKKRDLKQAAMQQLLTGRTRLPGFNEEWKVKRLGDHVAFLRNGVNSRAELLPEGRVKYLHYGDIHASKGTYLSPGSLPAIPDAKATRLDRLQDGDLVFADASEDLVGVSKSVEMKGIGTTEIVPGQHTIAARFDKTVLADGFKGFLQFCPQFSTHLRRLAAGTKVYATNRAYISSVEMPLPSVPEQSAIAAVLLDMDAELALLEARLVKTRNLKQAMMQELLTGNIRLVQPAIATESPVLSGTHANIYFKRSVLAAEIISQLHDEPTFGHVKLEKMLFLVEHLCEVDTGSTYHRQAAGPYDNRALRSIDSQIKKQKWFEAQKQDTRYRYVPLEKAGDHAQYFERYYSSIRVKFDRIIAKFRTFNTERCEIVATLYSAWDDLIRQGKTVSDDAILIEVLERWHESKQRIPRDRWLKALDWMRDNHLVPPGCYHAEKK